MPLINRKAFLFARFRKAIPAILLAIAGTYVLSRLGTLHGLERMALDAEMTESHQVSPSICVVNITDADYDNIFDGRSPLQPQKLHDLISAVALSGPAVIGVDIDTSHPQFQNLTIEPDWPPVIWERDISTSKATNESQMEPLDVLGGQNPRFNENSGIPVLLNDPEDKVTRFYTRCVDTDAGTEQTFVYAVATAYLSAHRAPSLNTCANEIKGSKQPLFIRYALKQGAALYERDASQVLGLSGTRETGGQSQIIPAFSKKIILIGGTYRDFDRHFTPIGTLPGTAVLANAIQTELDGGGTRAYSPWSLFLLEFLASALLVLLFHFFALSPWKTLAWGVPTTVAISLAFSFVSFRTFSRFANFAPTLLAVLVFEIYEHVRHESVLRVIHSDEAGGQA
jgi:CHASE2 domain-containing sensor protein